MSTLTTPSRVPAPSAETRSRMLVHLCRVLDASGVRWALQGAPDAPGRWVAEGGVADLDVWVERLPRELVSWLDSAPGACVARADDPRRLRHVSWARPDGPGLAVIDVTVGDLVVGAVPLVPADAVRTVPGPHGPRLDGQAAVADLLVRPLLRGRSVRGARLREAQRCWADLGLRDRHALVARLGRTDAGLSAAVVDLLQRTGEPGPGVRWHRRVARRAMVRAALAPRALPATVAQWRTVLPAGRAAGPLGLRTRGVVVALVGTDGAGKSAVAEALAGALAENGTTCRSAYFGIARGNLPGVALARRVLLGRSGPGGDGDAPTPGPGEAEHPRLRAVGAWCYAAEYAARWALHVAPGLVRHDVVVCDRWITDLRESPWPASSAPRWLERLLPAPHVLVLPDAPDALIHARKPERSAAEQARQQDGFRALADSGYAGRAVLVDTSRRVPDVSRAVAAVLEAAHGTARRRTRSR